MNSYSLLIKPIPYPDESAASLLIRAAEANGFSSVYSLCKIQSSSPATTLSSHVTHQKRFRKLLQLLGLSDEYTSLAFALSGSTQAMPRKYSKIILKHSFFRKDVLAFCPKCLSEQSYWRRHWLLRPYTVCLKHGTQLYDCCPKCKKALNISRNRINFCLDCEQDLRILRNYSKNYEAVQWFMDTIYHSDQKIINQLSDYWLALEKFDWKSNNIDADHQRIQMAYEYLTNPEQSKKTLIHIINSRVPKAHPQIQAVYLKKQSSILREYANSILADCNHVDQPATNHLKQLFSLDQTRTILDISYTRLKTLIQKEKLATIKNARGLINISSIDIERLLLDESHKVPLLSSRVQDVPKGDLLTLPEIAGQLQIHKEIVRDLGVKGWLKIDKKKVDGHVKNVAPPEIIEEFSKKYISVGTLARQLNVNSTNLADKLKHFGIEPVGGPHIDGLRTNLYQQTDIEYITTEMINDLKIYETYTGRPSKKRLKMVHYESDPTLYFSLRHTSSKLHISPSKVAVLVQKGILKKDEHCHSVIRVEKASVSILIEELNRQDFIALEDAAKELGCAINWLHINWIKTGYLKLHDFVYWKFVKTDDIDQVKALQKEYMTAIEASKLLGMHRTHIINLKAQGKIDSISFGESNSLNLYRREDVLKLLKQQNDGESST